MNELFLKDNKVKQSKVKQSKIYNLTTQQQSLIVNKKRNKMTLRISLQCYHEYRCQCKPITETKVSKEEVTYNLIRCNPALARYFNNTTVLAQTLVERNSIKPKEDDHPYISIVEQKNLNILLPDQYPLPKHQLPSNKQLQSHPQSLKINNFISTEVQTSPLSQSSPTHIKPDPRPQSPREKQIKQHFKQLKQTSRYLSDTGFRKYFNRQVFQNYGRQNTHGTNDGIIYGNYLKTHNINPHIGYNQPKDQETFYHALTTASPQKLLSPNVKYAAQQNKNRNMSQSRLNEENQNSLKPLKKHENDTEQIIGDNVKHHEKLNELSKSQMMALTNKSSVQKTKSINRLQTHKNSLSFKANHIHQQKSTPQTHYYSNSIQSQYVNTKQIIQPITSRQRPQSTKYQLSPRVNFTSGQKQQINKLSQIKHIEKNECPVDMIKQRHMEHIMADHCILRQQADKRAINY